MIVCHCRKTFCWMMTRILNSSTLDWCQNQKLTSLDWYVHACTCMHVDKFLQLLLSVYQHTIICAGCCRDRDSLFTVCFVVLQDSVKLLETCCGSPAYAAPGACIIMVVSCYTKCLHSCQALLILQGLSSTYCCCMVALL